MTLILIALRDYALENKNTGIDAAELEESYLKNKKAPGEEKYKLLLTGDDKKNLIELIDRTFNYDLLQNQQNPNANQDEQDEIFISQIAENYNYFKKEIEGLKKSTTKKIYDAIKKLKIVNITLDNDDDDPQAIFESLNSSGKDLSQSDLIRNFVLMGLKPKELQKVYNDSWAPMENFFGNSKNNTKVMHDFFKTFLTFQNAKIPKENELYETFKTWFYKTINQQNNTVADLCFDLHKKALYYTNIKFARSDDQNLKDIYSEIKELKMEVVFPFLLKLHADCFRRNPVLQKKDLIKIMKLCISYVVRRGICDLKSSELNNTFASLKNKIDPKNYVASIEKAFSEWTDNKRFPNDEEFSQAFKTCKIYKKQRCNYILGRLANFDSRDYFNPKNYTIEHIMPQTLSDYWREELGNDWKRVHETYLHTIGNLTLTKYNSEMSNKSFPEKRGMHGGFRESGSRLNSFLCNQEHWREEQITQRSEELTNIALQIWPRLSNQIIINENEPVQPDNRRYNQTDEIFKILDTRIKNLCPGHVTCETFKDFYKYEVRGYVINNVQKLAAVTQQQTQIKIHVPIDLKEVDDPLGICINKGYTPSDTMEELKSL